MTEVENAYLASAISSHDNLNLMFGESREWFSSQNNKIVFDAIKMIHANGDAVDVVLLKLFIQDHFDKDATKHIDTLMDCEYNPANFEQYQGVLRENFLKNSMVSALQEALARVQKSGQGDIQEAVDQTESEVLGVSQNNTSAKQILKLGDVGVEVMKKIKITKETGVIPYIGFTGLPDVDRLIGGFSAGDLIIIAGRPSSGKTAMGVQMARHNANNGKAIGFISLEMQSEQIYLRQLSFDCGIDSRRIVSGEFTDLDFTKMAKSWKRINSMPIYIDDKSPMSEIQIRSVGRRMVSSYGIEILVVDYLTLIDAAKSAENRQQEITKISRSLKSLAKELNIVVIALSQLSRKVEERNPPRPILSDLRESGAIEQDADVVIFIYRPEEYGIAAYEDGSPTTKIAEIIVAKARNADTGSAKTIFEKERGEFIALAHNDQQDTI